MTRALLTVLALAAVAAAAGPDSLQAEIDGYLRAASLEDGRRIHAPATGGLLGWFVPQIYAWDVGLDGEMASTSGDVISFKDDLALDTDEFSVVVQAQISTGGVGLRFDGFVLEFNGTNTISRTFDFGGQTFTINDTITSSIEIAHYRMMIMAPIVKTGAFAVSLETGIAGLFLDGTVTSQTVGSASESADIPIPLVGVLGQMRVGRLLFEVEVVGLTIDYFDVKGTVLDVQASVGIQLFKIVALRAGFRSLTIEGDADNFHVDATMEGFFVGASLQF